MPTKNQIDDLRSQINSLDQKILKLLSDRLKIIKKIAKLKKINKKPIFDRTREEEIIKKMPGEFEKNIFKKILSQSRKEQRKLYSKEKN